MIRFAEESDIDDIMKFIDQYWKKDHILARDKEFFYYQHYIDGETTFVISRTDSGEMNGIVGYITYAKKIRDISTAIWKVVNPDVPMLGFRMMKYLVQNSGMRIFASPGINMKTTKELYQYLKFDIGKMTQWYRLRKTKQYHIADIKQPDIPETKEKKQLKLVQFDNFQEVEKQFDFNGYYAKNPKLYKESWYIKKRYFEHPIYRYKTYGVLGDNKKAETLLMIRREECNGSAALRWVDCIGKTENIKYITKELDALLEQEKAEYMDIYETGVPDEYFYDAGWCKVENSGNIIPNYFSPYVCENIDIYYTTSDKDVILFKGDSDQDRPS